MNKIDSLAADLSRISSGVTLMRPAYLGLITKSFDRGRNISILDSHVFALGHIWVVNDPMEGWALAVLHRPRVGKPLVKFHRFHDTKSLLGLLDRYERHPHRRLNGERRESTFENDVAPFIEAMPGWRGKIMSLEPNGLEGGLASAPDGSKGAS